MVDRSDGILHIYQAAIDGNHQWIDSFLMNHTILRENLDIALTYGAKNGKMESVQTLLYYGADPSFNEERACRLAARSNHLAIVQILISKSSNLEKIQKEADSRGHQLLSSWIASQIELRILTTSDRAPLIKNRM